MSGTLTLAEDPSNDPILGWRPGVWNNRETWPGRSSYDLTPGPLQDIRESTESAPEGRIPCILCIGPGGSDEMRELQAFATPGTFIWGIEASENVFQRIYQNTPLYGNTSGINVSLPNLRFMLSHLDGWHLDEHVNQEYLEHHPNLCITTVCAFNSLGIAIHQDLAPRHKKSLIHSFLDQLKPVLGGGSNTILVTVGSAVLNLSYEKGTFVWRAQRCYEAQFRRLNPNPYVPSITELRQTDMWDIWIETLREREDVIFLDSSGNETTDPKPLVTTKATSIDFARLVPSHKIEEPEDATIPLEDPAVTPIVAE
jgi:hypothetical protein